MLNDKSYEKMEQERIERRQRESERHSLRTSVMAIIDAIDAAEAKAAKTSIYTPGVRLCVARSRVQLLKSLSQMEANISQGERIALNGDAALE